MEGFGHVEENCTVEPRFVEIPGYSFNDAGQLQGRYMSWSIPKLPVSHQSAFLYFIQILASRIFSNNFPVVSKRLIGPKEEGSAEPLPG